ncbi:lipoprotein [Spiroplasma sp. BIUS-1]|uniref:lipoprotein n=1 Tax=Spiroplasma sp. BIUS-1 TaxID=216964 RepID=UPI001398CEB8|nr:lipoprotein [Spiroplasma sp. BIUS-1]QHX36674.1 hypothetical protein SBIUS_v1c04210 [Spiroplasma sp. BIUS-1]
MKKILSILSVITLAPTTSFLVVSCGPGDITFKSKLSSSISNLYISYKEGDILDEKFVLNWIYNSKILNTPELQKGIYVQELTVKENQSDEYTAKIIVTEESIKFEVETFISEIKFFKN